MTEEQRRPDDPWGQATDEPRAAGEPGAGEPGAGGEPREARELWSEVGRRFGDLGRAVRTHLEPESPDSASWSPPPAGGSAAGPRDDLRDDQWAEARDTARRLGRSVQRLTTQAGEAARDPVVRESVQEAARTLGAAIGRTAEDLGAQLRQGARSPRWSDPSRPRPESRPPVAPVRPDDDPP